MPSQGGGNAGSNPVAGYISTIPSGGASCFPALGSAAALEGVGGGALGASAARRPGVSSAVVRRPGFLV
jgi:hypothetical protein